MKMRTQHAKTYGGASKLGMKFVAANTYILKRRSQTNNLTFHLKKVEKEEQAKLKASRGYK